MKKVIAILLAVMMCALSAAALAETTIQWWTPNWDETESREMAAEFEEANPDIKVELVITDWDTYKARVTSAISDDNAPELYTVLTTDVVPFAQLGLLEPLNEIAAAAGVDFDDLLASAVAIASIGDTVYGIPFRHDGSGIYYNVDMLKEAGYDSFPTTWAEMVEMSKKLTKDGVYAFAWPLGNQANAVTRLVQQLYTYGGDVLPSQNNFCGLGATGNKVKGAAFPTAQIGVRAFATAVIPGIDGMGCTTANGWTVIMASKAKEENKEAAAKFLAYITTPENQARLTDSFPASITALAYDKFATEYLKPFGDQLANSKAEPTYTRWAEMEPIIYEYIQYAVSGTMTVDEACENMTNDITALLAY